jgi:uncharacterized protein (UPF0333 family)
MLYLNNKKAQIAPFLVLILVAVILAIGATFLIGEFSSQKTRLIITTDSALISAGTRLARALNLVRQIHFRMLLNYAQLQIALLARGVWSSKAEAIWAAINYAIGIEKSKNMYEQAKKVVEEMPKDIRVKLFDALLQNLIDEPKPFPCAQYDDAGKCVKIDYEKYLEEDSIFGKTFLACKKGDLNITGCGNKWYMNNMISYSWNKRTKDVCIEYAGDKCIRTQQKFIEGDLSIGEPTEEKGGEKYDSYLKVELINAPTSISIRPQRFVLFFLWACGPKVCPGFLPHPYAWISKVNVFPSKQFGVRVTKLPFRSFPYFISDKENNEEKNKKPELIHESIIAIRGSVTSGYEVKLVK